MIIDTKQFDCHYSPFQTHQQLQKAYINLQSKYTKILTQFNSFKQSSISSYQKVLQQLQKCKNHNENFVKKLQKKYQNLLHQQRIKSTKNIEKMLSQFQKQRSNLKQIIFNKNESIQKLSELLHKSQQEKSQIIEENTQNLINIVKSQQNCLQTKKYSHTQLMKMYQYLLEQNNCLKKQLMKVAPNQIKSNQKTKRNKNSTQIIYTDQSQKVQSMYVSAQNRSNIAKKESSKARQHCQSLNMQTSVLGSQYLSKPTSTYKPKISQNAKKNKINSSYHTNDISQNMDQKSLKRKELKKPPTTSQNTKKLK